MQLLSTDFFTSELLKYSTVGLFCAIFLLAIVVLINWIKNWILDELKHKDERIKKLEERLDYYEKNDRQEMLTLIERSNVIHERSEKLWEEMKILLIRKQTL